MILVVLAIFAWDIWMSMIINERPSGRGERRVIQAKTSPSSDFSLYETKKSHPLREGQSYETSAEESPESYEEHPVERCSETVS